MGLIGAGRVERQEKCVVCQKTFEEDELRLLPYLKTQTVELMCDPCSKTQVDNITEEVPLTANNVEDKIKITTTKKPNEMKELVNETKKEVKAKSMCSCAKFPLCKAIRAIQAFDEFSNSEIRAYFIRCPMCGSYAIKDICRGCRLPFCMSHIFRHRNCKEGK